jgi:SAM-dependent methyltransferase
MVALARRRLQGRARVHAADLQRPLDMVAYASIDLVVASLVLHYLRDWRPLLAELHRCLAPRGALVFSVHHPITGWQLSGRTGYHRTELVSEVELGRAEGDRPHVPAAAVGDLRAAAGHRIPHRHRR